MKERKVMAPEIPFVHNNDIKQSLFYFAIKSLGFYT